MAKPKLELQVNIPTKIKLLQDEPATGQSSYGYWWLYNIECEGNEYSYFAPETVVKQLKENNVREQDEVIITKRLIKKGKNNIAQYDVEVLQNEKVKTSEVGSNGNGSVNGSTAVINNEVKNNAVLTNNGQQENKIIFSKEYSILRQSMNEALLITDELGGNFDVTKLGITLFLSRARV